MNRKETKKHNVSGRNTGNASGRGTGNAGDQEKIPRKNISTPVNNQPVKNDSTISGKLTFLQILNAIKAATGALEPMIEEFQSKLGIDTALTGTERLRLFGVRSRKFGFITKAWNIVQDNQNFIPSNFSLDDMSSTLVLMEATRQLTLMLNQFHQLADDYLLTNCDTTYRDALRIYGNLREQSRGRVPGADALFQELRQFFTLRRRRPGETESVEHEFTEHELERDFKRLVHGTADGEIVVKNESPHVSGGVHEVVDDVQTGRKRKREVRSEELER